MVSELKKSDKASFTIIFCLIVFVTIFFHYTDYFNKTIELFVMLSSLDVLFTWYTLKRMNQFESDPTHHEINLVARFLFRKLGINKGAVIGYVLVLVTGFFVIGEYDDPWSRGLLIGMYALVFALHYRAHIRVLVIRSYHGILLEEGIFWQEKREN